MPTRFISALFFSLLTAASVQAQPDLALAFRTLAVRDDGSVFYAGSRSCLHESRNELRTWRPLYLRPAGEPQPDVQQVIVHPSDNSILLVYASSPRPTIWVSRDAGASWRRSLTGLPALADSMELFQTSEAPFETYLRVRRHATDADEIFRTDDRGGSWVKQADLPENASNFTVNAAMPELMFVNVGVNVWRSLNGGADWGVSGRLPFSVDRTNGAPDLVSDPANPTSLIATANGSRNFTVNGLFQSLDQGATWNRSFGPTGANQIYLDRDWPQVFVSALNSRVLYVSRSRGQTFERIEVVEDPSVRSVTAVLVDPRNTGLVYLALPGGPVLYRSADSGQTWRPSPARVLGTLAVLSDGSNLSATPGGAVVRGEVSIGAVESLSAARIENWDFDYELQSDAAWLTFENANGNTGEPAVLFADPTGLAEGEHRATVTVASASAANSPFAFDVRLAVTEPGDPVLFSSSIVNAGGFAGDTISASENVSIFGADLAQETAAASALPLPASLAGTSVEITDSAGATRPCVLFFVAAGQINCHVDGATALGAGTLTVRTPTGETTAPVQVAPVSPGLFSANASGMGAAAASAVRVAGDGSQTPVEVVDLSANPRRSVPIDLGPDTDTVVLLLFGTGFRNFGGAVEVLIGGQPAQVLGVAAQPEFVGLDQINVVVPRSLGGAGVVDVRVMIDGLETNVVSIEIQ